MKNIILLTEDSDHVRNQMVTILERADIKMELNKLLDDYLIETAEHMAKARDLHEQSEDQIALIIMDVMLPETEAKYKIVTELQNKREKAYDHWLELEENGETYPKSNWIKARFLVDSFDQDIFKNLNLIGGIALIKEWADVSSDDGKKYSKPVLYLTARESDQAEEDGMKAVLPGKARWLSKPAKSEQIIVKIKELLGKHTSKNGYIG